MKLKGETKEMACVLAVVCLVVFLLVRECKKCQRPVQEDWDWGSFWEGPAVIANEIGRNIKDGVGWYIKTGGEIIHNTF